MIAQQQDSPTGGMVLTPLSSNCATAADRAEHACFGISPFNSYFSTARIRQLAAWGRERFARVDFFVPDTPSSFTLEALGYPPDRAAWKARRQGQYIRNKIRTALESLDAVDAGHRILGWAELQTNAEFVRLHGEVCELYARDEGFRVACRAAAAWVLSGKLSDKQNDDQSLDEVQVECAVRYFLAELPLFIDTPSIVGSATSVFCYHKPPEVLRRLYRRELSCRPASGQGFGVLEAADHLHAETESARDEER